MFQSLMLFLAPATDPAAAAADRGAQSVQPPPPAVAGPTPRPRSRVAALCFCARVIGSAVGFAVLFSGCWLTLRLLQVLLERL